MIEMTSGKLLLSGVLGGSLLGLAALAAWTFGIDGGELDLVERYGVLGLLAVVIWLWNNSLVKNDARRDKHMGALVEKMSELVRTNDQIKDALDAVAERLKEDRADEKNERERAVQQVLAKLDDGQKDVLQQLSSLKSV